MTPDETAERLADLERQLAQHKTDTDAFQGLMLEVTRDAYANQRLLLSIATLWVQTQPDPLKAVDIIRRRSLEWQGDMSPESRLLLESNLNLVELAATKQIDT